MTHDPEAAERLARDQADAYFVEMHDDVVFVPQSRYHDWAQEAADLIRTQAAEIERLKQGMVDVAMSLNKTAEYQVAELLSEIDQLRVALQKARHDTPAPPAAAESAGGELREALVRLLQIITRNGSLDDGRTLYEVIADALLAAGWTRKREEG